MKYIFSNILGSFVIDEQKKTISKEKGEYKELPAEKYPLALELLKDQQYFADFHTSNLSKTKKDIKASVSQDHLITQAISNIGEIEKVRNLLSKRVREWYSLYFPELEEKIESHEHFIEAISGKTREQLIKEFKLKSEMGSDLKKEDVDEILEVAVQIQNLTALQEKHEKYLEAIMKKHCPNILELAGVTIGARLLEIGKGLKHLAMLPASTIQLLGAEKALFRHLKTGAKSPKFGVIMQHQVVQKAKEKGKAARALADKLSLCARIDYFKGEAKAAEYKKELEKRFL
ncbi:hypothetical protein COV20_04465 [Candidatus Woesearchaeota archaeon CG10_big_fil_rev_8_21_14_0_10_45_16]|nr:MAG: hypothetical protein COV20_04465 [Candidatus Woesearchaeota archaeon CG10_big_fil_rev_8_21_14_0_10_45_16]